MMLQTFEGCRSLRSLDLHSINFSKTSSISQVFKDCISLKSLNLGNVKLNPKVQICEMFENCNSLQHVTIGRNNQEVANRFIQDLGTDWIYDPKFGVIMNMNWFCNRSRK